jgi:hypothetical protein
MYNQTRRDQAGYRYVGNQALNVLAETAGLAPYGADAEEQNAIDENSGATTDPSKLVSTGRKSDGGRDILVDPDTGWGYVLARSGNNTGAPVPIGEKIPGFPLNKKAKTAMDGVANKLGHNPTMKYFQASPDYNFRLNEGIRATDRSAASRGLLLSGAQNKAVQRYGSDLASGEFGSWWNRMSALSGIGQTATNAVGAAGQNYAANAGNSMMASADARASGYLANANTLASGANNLAYLASNYGARSNATANANRSLDNLMRDSDLW